jgi:hypothetical protein
MTKIELPGEKRKGRLTLLRRPRALTPKEFNALSFEERLEMVRLAEGRAKYQLILEAADCGDLVQALPAQDLFILIKELGMEDVAELVSLASTEQVTTFIDLDCWDADRIKGEEALKWLVPTLAEGNEEKIGQILRELDFPLLVLILQQFVTVVHGPEALLDEDLQIEQADREKIYQVQYRDSETAKLIGGLLDVLYRRDQDFYCRLLEAVRQELPSDLEEWVYLQRGHRLMDVGFPDPFEALALYASLDPETFDPSDYARSPDSPPVEGVAPSLALTFGRPGNLLAEVLSEGISETSAWDLSFLLNRAMVADRVDVGDRAGIREELDLVYGCLNLALEHLCGADVEKAAGLFDRTYLVSLFRLGFSLLLSLQRRARVLRDSVVGPYLDGPYAGLVAALSSSRPRYFTGLEETMRSGTRPFAGLGDLQRTSEWLAAVEVQHRLFVQSFPFDLPAPETLDLTGCQPEEANQVTLSDFFLTALANRLCGRSFLPEPFPAAELERLLSLISIDGRLAEALRQETLAWLESLQPGASAFGEFCCEIWDTEFCPLDPRHFDARFVGGLIIRRAPGGNQAG